MTRQHEEASRDKTRAPAGTTEAETANVALAITHAEMDSAYEQGEAVEFGQSIPWLVRYRDAWWVVYRHGWLRVVDGLAEVDLDQLSARLAAAEDGEEAPARTTD